MLPVLQTVKSVYILTPCHPAEIPPAHPFAQPETTRGPDRCHCVTAGARNHRAEIKDINTLTEVDMFLKLTHIL